MSKRKPDVYLQDILESIGHIQRYLDNVSEDEFYCPNFADQYTVIASLNLMEINLLYLTSCTVNPIYIYQADGKKISLE